MMTLEVFSVILVINIITNFQPKLGHMRVGNALEKKLMPSKEKNVLSTKFQGSFSLVSCFLLTHKVNIIYLKYALFNSCDGTK